MERALGFKCFDCTQQQIHANKTAVRQLVRNLSRNSHKTLVKWGCRPTASLDAFWSASKTTILCFCFSSKDCVTTWCDSSWLWAAAASSSWCARASLISKAVFPSSNASLRPCSLQSEQYWQGLAHNQCIVCSALLFRSTSATTWTAPPSWFFSTSTC